jgi:hypothetical protein
LLSRLTDAVGQGDRPANLTVHNADQALPSAFPVTDLAVASMANAAVAAKRVAAVAGMPADASIEIDARLASLWFGFTIEPQGWKLPPVWDSVAGIYACGDRFVRLHTNAPHHKAAALQVLQAEEQREAVAVAVAAWDPFELETAVVEAGGVASAFRSRAEWAAHPQGQVLAAEALVHREQHGIAQQEAATVASVGSVDRPLHGVRVLDLTRVLAGPVATRLLAGLGADVLRIDPPVWSEAGVAAEVNLGKRCARLDLRDDADRAVFEQRLAEADIVVHGYRRDALAGLGYDDAARRAINPHVVDVSLNAWGHTGPWCDRRGFDSIVQIAAGVAHRGMTDFGADEPRPLPVQALDHATGYTLAACALHGWAERVESGTASTWKTSLAAHAELLWPVADGSDVEHEFAPLGPADLAPGVESTTWGPLLRARPPLSIAGIDLRWASGAADHGTSPASWAEPSTV